MTVLAIVVGIALALIIAARWYLKRLMNKYHPGNRD